MRGGKRVGAGRPNFLGVTTSRISIPAQYGPILREIAIKLLSGEVKLEDIKNLLE